MQPATALLILAVAWVANRLVRRAIRRLVASMSEDRGLAALRAPTALARTGEIPSLRRVQRAETVGALLASVASFGIWTLAGLMALGTLGLDLGPLIAGAGIVGVAVGNRSQGWARALVDVEVAYSTDLDDATRTIERVAHELYADEHWASKILEQPEVWGVEELGPDGIRVRLVAKTRPLEQWKVARELRARLKVAFDQAGIEVSAQKVLTADDGQGQPAA